MHYPKRANAYQVTMRVIRKNLNGYVRKVMNGKQLQIVQLKIKYGVKNVKCK